MISLVKGLNLCLLLCISSIVFAKGIYENFDKASLNHQWQVYGGNWSWENGEAILPNVPGYKALTERKFSDFSYKARIKINSGEALGILFRITYASEEVINMRGYIAFILPGLNQIGIGKFNNDWTQLAENSITFEYGQWYDLSVDAFGSNIKVYLNGELKLEVDDNSFSQGAIGVLNWQTVSRLDSLTLAPSVEGIYSLSGNDYAGNYSGRAELRRQNGHYKLVKLKDYTELKFQDFQVSSAVEGTAQAHPDGSITMDYDLDLVGYIKHAEGFVREADFNKNTPLRITETLRAKDIPNEYSGEYSAVYKETRYSFPESWRKTGALQAEPIWTNQRLDIATTDLAASQASLETITKLSPFYKESEFHALPQIAPYTQRQEFQDRIHYWVFDPTDYNYYQQNPNRLRVIQKIIDPISLTEAKLRNSAYRYNLNAKAAFFDEEVARLQINELGFVSKWDSGENRYLHDGDSLLWTGVYVSAMAKKYLVTRDRSALDKMLKSLNAVINAIDIVRTNPNDNLGETFARTIMLDRGRANTNPEWRRGTMQYSEFSAVEYKRDGNPDMSKGIMIAAYWSTKALRSLSSSEYADISKQYGDISTRMIEALIALRNEHKPLFVNNCGLSKLDQFYKWPRSMQLNLVLYNLVQDKPNYKHILNWNDDIKECYRHIKIYSDQTELNFSNIGGVVSDWSANHLGIWSLYLNYMGFVDAAGEQSEEANDYRQYFQDTDEHMLTHRMGLFKLISGTLRYKPNHPFWIEQAVWRLREIPTTRGEYEIDWTINPKHTASPYPELIWKYTGKNPQDRVQSLRAYPLFESAASSYYWKQNPFNLHKGPIITGLSGIDFLIAYWFGRYHGVITEDM
jgi:hypothetical protein